MLKKIGIALCLMGYYAALYGLYSALGFKGVALGLIAAICACVGAGMLLYDNDRQEEKHHG